AEAGPSPESWDCLLPDIFEQGREQPFLVLVMPGIEPNRAGSAALQHLFDEIHQGAFTAAPFAGDRDDNRRLGVAVADEQLGGARDRPEVEAVVILEPDRIVVARDVANIRRAGFGRRAAQYRRPNAPAKHH